MMRSSRAVSSPMIAEIARARGVVELELRHRERFEIAAHRRHRRRQLVRDVGQQLPPRAIRRGQRLGARREIVGHRVERRGHRRDFVAAAHGRAGREIAARPAGAPRLRPPRSRRRAGPKISTAASSAPTTSAPRRRAPASAHSARSRNPNGARGGTTTTPASSPPTMIGAGRRAGRRPDPGPIAGRASEAPCRGPPGVRRLNRSRMPGATAALRAARRAARDRSGFGMTAPGSCRSRVHRRAARRTAARRARTRRRCSRRDRAPGRARAPRRARRDGLREAFGGWLGSVGPERDTTQTNSIACTTSSAARHSDEADRDAPVEAAVPALAARG